MKNLFKILLVVLAIVVLISCDESISKVSNPLKETTIANQQAAKDTVLMTFESDEKILILNKETNLVEYELYGYDRGDGAFLAGIFIGILVGLFIMSIIINIDGY